MASEIAPNRKHMKIALVGVRPADQVTLKGYLRVLLRLDVELEWVSATDLGIDLFMINDEFRGAASVNKLLETNAGVPVLYVSRNDASDGGISQDLLTLPLKQINLLHDWLNKNVRILGGQFRPTNSGNFSNNANQQEIRTTNQTNQVVKPITAESLQGTSANLTDIIDVIEHLQNRAKSMYELVDNGQSVAIIDAYRQLIWTSHAPKLSSDWRLKTYTGQPLDDKDAKDSSNWLWQAGLQSELLTTLIDNTSKYQIRYWAKPTQENRRNALAVMTAIESAPMSVMEISQITGIGSPDIKKILSALLLSGNLSEVSYKSLKSQYATQKAQPISQPTGSTTVNTQTQVAQNQPVQTSPVRQAEPVPPRPEPTKEQVEQKEEKLGFLSRLRRKLGL